MKDITLLIIGAMLGLVMDIFFRQKIIQILLQLKRIYYRSHKGIDLVSGKPFQLKFGAITTGWVSLYGTGELTLDQALLRSELDNLYVSLPADLEKLRLQMLENFEKKEAEGHSNIWNGQRFALKNIEPTRLGVTERMGLWLKFQLTDYSAYSAITSRLDETLLLDSANNPCTIRDKYFPQFNPDIPNSFVTHSFGLNLLVISKDQKVAFVQRNSFVARSKNKFHISVKEGMQYPLDIDEHGRPSFIKAAIRGLWEELGIDLNEINVNHKKIQFLNFGALADISEYALLGCIKLPLTAVEIEQTYYDSKDRGLETTNKLYLVDFIPEVVVDFINTHRPWTHHGIATIYYCLIRFWGYWETNNTIRKMLIEPSKLFEELSGHLTGK